jgi:metal-dependent amidase/aminoacylase/carboxypeptidase family protein
MTPSKFRSLLVAVAWFALLRPVTAAQSSSLREIDNVYPEAHQLYLDLHQHPELSGQETETAAKLAARLRSAGYEVTEHAGNTGVVALMKNGAGPTIMLRTKLDALPVEEKPVCLMPARCAPKTMPDATCPSCTHAGTTFTWRLCSERLKSWLEIATVGMEL